MNFNVSAWAIRKPVPSLVLFMVLIALGLYSFAKLPITRFPNIDIPIVQITITQAGAAPSELETQVGKRVEDAVAGVAGVKHITAAISEGVATIIIEFRLETDQDRAINDVKDAIAQIRADLPRTIDEPIVQRLDVVGLPIVTFTAAAATMTAEELSWFVDDTVARRLQGVKGVSKIDRVGGVEREIRINLDPDRLLALGVTAGDVNAQVRLNNIDLAGGRGEIAGREQAIRTLASRTTLNALAATMITLPSGRKIRLDELGTVVDTFAEPRTYARLDGRPVVAFAISRAKGASDTDVAKRIDAEVDALRKAHPKVTFTKIDDTVLYTKGSYDSTMTTLIEGAALAVLVVFLFLKDWRATLIAAVALPLSIIPTFWAMDAMGFSLNVVSLLAVTIVVGILVDDAIVEIENIVRHMRMGKSAYRAALDGADEIGLAVIAITFTIIAVFAPVSFMGGIAGQYFKQFGLTVAFAVFFSLLVARLITPLMSAYFMRAHGPAEEREGWLLRAYTRLVRWSVRRRLVTVALGLMIFAGSIYSMQLLPSGFLPNEDQSRLLLAFELPPGSKLEDTKAMSARLAERIAERPQVKTVFTSGGVILGSSPEVRKATLTIQLTPKDKRELTQAQIRTLVASDIARVPDIRFWFLKEDGSRTFQIVVIGDEGAAVARAAADLTSQMKRVPLLANVVSTAELDRPELRISPRAGIAAQLGVTTQAISEAVRIATIGDVSANLAKFNAGDRQVPIRVQLRENARAQRDILEALKVRTTTGKMVPLSTVATFRFAQGPTSIERYDRRRRVVIGADLQGTEALGEAMKAVLALPAAKAMPEGVALRQFGEAEIMADVFSSFATAMAAGLMMVYAVLVLLFASFLQPITILFSLPLSIGGAIAALLITSKPISLPVVIGILMLMGIVTKNAIMLVDFAIEEMQRGVAKIDAIADAGRKRARPIVMTTIAMAGGMFPSALAIGAGGEFRAPMAIAVIGGLLVSTVLSLLFVPAVFAAMDDLSNALKWLFGRFVGQRDEDDDAAPTPARTPAE
ncbi:MAG: efflux RND transporter permease subunit [Pseudomonadota bacterium]